MAQLVPVDPFDLIIFGGSGDLAQRKLLPSLFHRDQDGQFSDDSRILAVGRSAMDRESYLDQVATALQHWTAVAGSASPHGCNTSISMPWIIGPGTRCGRAFKGTNIKSARSIWRRHRRSLVPLRRGLKQQG